MHTHHERGFALILALFLMSALSVIGASLMFLSQTETFASMNYRMMSQARYAAEGGVQKASSFLLDPAQYPVPTAADLLGTSCNRTVSPVTCSNQEVILSASTSRASNYPVAAVQTAYNLAGQGTLAAGGNTLTYNSYAKLLGLQVFESYGGGTSVVATWEITGEGGLFGSPRVKVEVLGLIETPKAPASSYGVFGTDNTCGAVTFGGNVTVNSYDSTGLTGTAAPPMSATGGDVGTNGNLTISGSVDVQGNLYTPRTGVGACSSSALTTTGSAQLGGSMVQIPAAVSYPSPTLPGPSPLPAVSISSPGPGTCALLGFTAANCAYSGSTITLTGNGLTLPSISLSSNVNLVVTASSPAARYNFNSIKLSGGSTVGVSATSSNEGAIIGIIGKNPDNSIIAAPVDFTGGTYTSVTGCASCSQFDASILQIVYDGTGEIKMGGNSGAAVTIYAPNALFSLSGTADVYGSVLASRINQSGNSSIHYDRRLRRDFYVAGYPMMGTFNWKRN